MNVSVTKCIPELDCILHYTGCPEPVQVFLLLLKSVRVLLLILPGSGFHCDFPPFSLWCYGGSTLQVKCSEFALFDLKYAITLQNTLLWSNMDVYVLAILVLNIGTSLSRISGWRHPAQAEPSGSFGYSDRGGNQKATWYCWIMPGRNRTGMQSVLSKHKVLKF